MKADFNKAEVCFRKALKIADSTENRFNLGLVLLNRLELTAAEEHFKKVKESYPENELNQLALFESLILQSKWQDAIDQIEILHDKYPENRQFTEFYEIARDVVKREKYREVKLLCKKAMFQTLKNNYEKALEQLSEALQYQPDNLEVLNNMGSIYMKKKDYKQAFSFYEKALAVAPDNMTIQKNLATAKRKLRH